MSLTTINQAQNILPHLFIIILLGLSYFNYFLIAEPVRFFFEISSLTGRILVHKFLLICNCILKVFELAYEFFQILCEDSLIFLKDASEKFTFAIYVIKELYLFLEKIGSNVLTKTLQIVKTFFDCFEFMYFTLATLKQVICRAGSTIWGFFIGIPDLVVFHINGIINFIKYSYDEIIININNMKEKTVQSIDDVYSLLLHVPLDSVYGLIIGAVVVSIIYIKFKDICCFLSSVILKFYQQATSLGINLWSGRFLENEARRCVDYGIEDDERFCIICQYHLKEVILFPCKHLCLCLDCSKQLAVNQPICPICRSKITETFKVYM